MSVSFAHIVALLVCLFTFARVHPETMFVIGQAFLTLTTHWRFLRSFERS